MTVITDRFWETRAQEEKRQRDRMPLTFLPCPICGEVEQMTQEGIWVITHNYTLHGMGAGRNYEVGS